MAETITETAGLAEASPVLATFLRSWNPDPAPQIRVAHRSLLADQARAWLAAGFLIHEYMPAFLRCGGLTEEAVLLERLPSPVADEDVDEIAPMLAHVCRTARDFAGLAAWATMGTVSRPTSGGGGWAGVRAACWEASGAAIRPAAGTAARLAAATAIQDFVGDAAGDATRAGAWGVAASVRSKIAQAVHGDHGFHESFDAAFVCATAELTPVLQDVTKRLQDRAVLLLERMMTVGE